MERFTMENIARHNVQNHVNVLPSIVNDDSRHLEPWQRDCIQRMGGLYHERYIHPLESGLKVFSSK